MNLDDVLFRLNMVNSRFIMSEKKDRENEELAI